MVGNHEAAGAIPAIQTHRHRPKDGTRDYESRWLRFESSRWLQTLLGVAQKQSAWVTTTMSLVQSQSPRLFVDVAQS